jgi:esterase/lipase superfamily enzyme
MNREHHKWYSHELQRDMDLLCFGHAGLPVLVFPTSLGKYYEYEDRHMVGTLGDRIERGELQIYCVDSVDAESWYHKQAHPYWRVQHHLRYERYIINDVLPLIRLKNQHPGLLVTGCSFGGYHAVNFALRHPDIVTNCVSMSGAFGIKKFLDGWYGDEAYFNNPPDFLPNMGDPWYLERYRRMRIVLATGEHDQCWQDNEQLAAIMRAKSIPHELYVWGDGTGHDWPSWLKMVRWYIP